MKYSVVEVLQDGRSYARVEDDDGTRFGQVVDLRQCETVEERDDAVRIAVLTARAIRVALQKIETASTRGFTLDEERVVASTKT
jgi:hypothetical protein